VKRPRTMAFVKHPQQAPWLVFLLAIAVLQLSGCTVGPNYRRPAAEVPSTYKEAAGWKPAEPNDQSLGGNWWTVFQDPQLNDLELQVNVSNQNLKAAEAQYQEARAALHYTRADLYPTVTACGIAPS
jgi:outer membrane protein TolC